LEPWDSPSEAPRRKEVEAAKKMRAGVGMESRESAATLALRSAKEMRGGGGEALDSAMTGAIVDTQWMPRRPLNARLWIQVRISQIR
jgi:hypothetical protein